MKFDYFLKICREISSIIKIWQTTTGTLHKDQGTFFTISRWVFLRMRNVSDKPYRENQNNHFILNNIFSPENRSVYEITWENILVPGRPQTTLCCMSTACWITIATNTHSYVITITFPLQQCLHERAPLLRYTYTVCLSACLVPFNEISTEVPWRRCRPSRHMTQPNSVTKLSST